MTQHLRSALIYVPNAARCMTWVGLYFSKSLTVSAPSLLDPTSINQHPTSVIQTYLRSPSLEPTKTQVSPSCFPKREPGTSVEMTCSIAFPTRPEPPVTRMVFFGDEDIDKRGSELVI